MKLAHSQKKGEKNIFEGKERQNDFQKSRNKNNVNTNHNFTLFSVPVIVVLLIITVLIVVLHSRASDLETTSLLTSARRTTENNKMK